MMHHNTQQGGQHKEGLVDRAKDLVGMGHKDHNQSPYVDPAVPQDKQNRYGNEDYASQAATIGDTYNTTPGYDATASKTSGAAYGTSSGIVGTETGTGAAYTTPGLGNTSTGYGATGAGYGTTAEYGTIGTGSAGALGTGATYAHPDKAAVLDSFGAIVTEPAHASHGPVDPLTEPAVIGVDAAGAHGAPVIPSTYNVDHTAHNTGPVVGAVDHSAVGIDGARGPGYGTTEATRSEYDSTAATHSTTATTGSTGTEHQKKGLMTNIKEKIHDVTDKLHHKK